MRGFFIIQKNDFPLIQIYKLFITVLISSLVFSPVAGYAQPIGLSSPVPTLLPTPGTMVSLSGAFEPVVIKGIQIFPDDPFRFDFFVDIGESNLEGQTLKKESSKLIKYFLAALTVPEDEMWVNLSPHEKNRVIPESFGVTEMGRDLLAQDYLLKQVTASLMYPEKELGEEFWSRVYKKAYEQYGTTEIPVDTFNKVWVIPQKAVVYEQGESAFIVESHLKVMTEGDYLSLEAAEANKPDSAEVSRHDLLTASIVKEIIIPELEHEVNEGRNFAPLRQIYHSMILAAWFKRNLHESILSQVYIGKNKTGGVDIDDTQAKEKIYRQYLKAFKTGVYNVIKEDYDPTLQAVIPRKYTSGGMKFGKQMGEVFKETSRISPSQAEDLTWLLEDKRIKRIPTVLNTNIRASSPVLSYAAYKGAEYIDGQIVGGKLTHPGGAKDISELRSQLKQASSDSGDSGFSGVVKMILPKGGGLTGIFGIDYWANWKKYSQKPVILIIRKNKIVEAYDLQNRKIFPFGKNIIYPGAKYENGKIIGGPPVNPNGSRTTITVKNHIKKNPEFTGVIDRVILNKRGGLSSLEYLGVKWWSMPGYEYASVTVVMVKGQVTGIYDQTGKRLFPFLTNYVYEGAEYRDGEAVGGRLLTPNGIYSRQEVNELLEKNPGFNGVIINVPLSETGGLTYFMGRNKWWSSKKGYENALVTIVIKNGEEITAYDKNKKKIFKRVRKKENIIYPGATYEYGNIIGAKPLNEQGTFNRDEMKKIVNNYLASTGKPRSKFTGVIDNVRLTYNGGLMQFFEEDLWVGMSGYSYRLVTVVMVDGEVVEVYDKKGERIFPFKENFIYKNAGYQDGEIIGGELINPQGYLDRFTIGKYLGEHPDFTGAITTRLLSTGGLPSFLDENAWASLTGYEYKPVIVVKENGKTTAVYDEQGNRIFPFDENFVYLNADFDEGEMKGGIPLTPVGIRNRKELNELLAEYPEFTGMIMKLKLLYRGVLGRLNGKLYLDPIKGYQGKSVSVKLDKGDVVAIYNDQGFMIWSEDRDRIGRDILNALWRSGDLEKLMDLFGEEGTNRLLYNFFDELTPKRLMEFSRKHYKDLLGNGIWSRGTITKEKKRKIPPTEIVEKIRSIELFQRQSSKAEFQAILKHQLFSLIYSSIVKDHRFLEALEKEIGKNGLDPMVKKAFEEIIQTYRDVQGFRIEGIKASTQLKFYQRFGVKFILDTKRVLVADKSGLGKTLQALAAAINVNNGKGAQKVFIICPDVSIRDTWLKDINQRLKGEQKVYVVKTRTDFESIKKWKKAQEAQFIIANYEILRGEDAVNLRENLKRLGIDFIIADEGHRMKNNSLLTEAVKEFDAPYKVLISASAQQGRTIGKIYNLLHWLYPEKYPSRKVFMKKYNTVEGHLRLKTEMKSFMLRRYKSDVLGDMPDLNIELYPVRLEGEQLRLYKEIEETFLNSLESDLYPAKYVGTIQSLMRAALDTALIRDISFKDIKTGEVFAVPPGTYKGKIGDVNFKLSFHTREPVITYSDGTGGTHSFIVHDGDILQMNGGRFEIGIKERASFSAKYDALDNMVNDIVGQNGENLAIFTGARKTVRSLKRRYEEKGYEVEMVYGGVNASKREKILKKFNKTVRPMILISTYQTFGESIDITGAHYGVLTDSPWLDREQIMDRLHRLGQEHDVTFTILVAQDTIDEHVEQVNWESDMVKSIVLDDSSDIYNSPNELTKKLILNKMKNEQHYARLQEFQKKVRMVNNGKRKQESSIDQFTEYDGDDVRIRYGKRQFTMELRDLEGDIVYIDGITALLEEIESWDEDLKGDFLSGYELATKKERINNIRNSLKQFFIKRFEDEQQEGFKVKDMILWDICNQMVPGFRDIDYDGKLEFMVELGTHMLRKLTMNPHIGEEAFKEELGDDAESLYNDTMYYLDTTNILKLFSLMGVIPQSYYYDGKLLKYEPSIAMYFSEGRIRYWDKQIVENIAPEWEVKPEDIHSVIQGDERVRRRVRKLKESEEKRLANQIRLGNKSAEEALIGSYYRYLKPIAERVIKSGRLEQAYGNKVRGAVDVDDLVLFGQNILVDLIGAYAENEIYYNTSLKEYLSKRLNPRIYTRGYQIAKEAARSIEPGELYGRNQLSAEPVGTDRLETVEQREIFNKLLEQEGFNDIEREMLMLFVFEGYAEGELLNNYFKNGQRSPSEDDVKYVANLIERFQDKMNNLGREGVRHVLENGVSSSPVDTVGGINLDPARLEIETRGQGSYGGPLHVDISRFQDPSFTGFSPVIIDIVPVSNLPLIFSN